MNWNALKSPGFRLYFTGNVLSVNGMWVLRILVSWIAWDVSGSASYVGLIAALSLAPTIISGPLFGVMVDRMNILFGAFLSNIIMLANIMLLFIFNHLGWLSMPVLTVMALAVGINASLHHPVRMSLGPRLVPSEMVSSVIALAAVNFNTARFLSPAIGGLVIEQLGIQTGLLVSFALFVPTLLIVPFLRPRPREQQALASSFLDDLKDGFRWLRAHPYLLQIMTLTALISVSIRAAGELLPVVADGLYQMGATGVGQLGSAIGAGALVSALMKTMQSSQNETGLLSGFELAVTLAGIMAAAGLGLALFWSWALLMAAIIGFSGTYLGVSMQARMQRRLPDRMRGRVMSLFVVLAMGSAATGSFLIGWLAELFSVTISYLCFGGGALVILGLIMAHSKTRTAAG